MKFKIKRVAGLMLMLLSFAILLVTAFVYEDQTNNVTQTIQEVATITLDQGPLGTIEEGETKVSTLNQILDVTTAKANVYLHFDTDLDSQSGNYDTYDIEVVADTVPGGSTLWSVDDVIATLTIAGPDTSSGIDLDTAGGWIFDFRVTTTAGQVTSDTPTTVTITVSAESTT